MNHQRTSMDVVELAVASLLEAQWNPNVMSEAMVAKLRTSVLRFGVVENFIVRPLHDQAYEVVSGNQRIKVYRELGIRTAPCVVMELDDAQAGLLAQALNSLHGEDDLGLKAELVRQILAELPEAQVLAVLPETAESLQALATLGQEDLAAHLRAWQQAQSAKLKNLQFRLTPGQLETVDEALDRIMPQVSEARADNPSIRGNALHLLCQMYLQRSDLP